MAVALRSPRKSSSALTEEDGLQFLWAVSYSDLLMVLMCFFIIFFSMDDSQQPNLLHEIAIGIHGNILSKGGGGEADSTGVGTVMPKVENSLKKDLIGSAFEITSTKMGSELRLQLPDNVFAQGAYEINPDLKKQLSALLQTLKPYSKQIKVIFSGHTDNKPLQASKSDLLRTNLDLSNLRASTAANFAIESGFEPAQVSTEGFGEFGRRSRTLSVRIIEQGAR
jgi:flagellar motor protein MotB